MNVILQLIEGLSAFAFFIGEAVLAWAFFFADFDPHRANGEQQISNRQKFELMRVNKIVRWAFLGTLGSIPVFLLSYIVLFCRLW